MKNLSPLVQGKIFGLIFTVTALFSAFAVFPESFHSSFEASLFGGEALNEFIATKLPFLHNLIRLIIFILVTTGISILIMSMLLKFEAKRILLLENEANESKTWDYMAKIPAISIVEILVFIWVLGWLVLSILVLMDIFSSNMNLLEEAYSVKTELLFRLSLIFGLLGGSLSSIKYFIPSHRKIKFFHIGYVFKYLSSPFFSSVIGFLSFLLCMNLQWFGLNYQNKQINVLALIFIFTLVGYFSETFIALLYALVKKMSEWLENSFALELGKTFHKK